MKVKLNKVSDGKWNVMANGEVIGECVPSYKHHGSYKVTFNNGDDTEIHAVRQTSVINMVTKHLSEKGMA